MRPVSRRVQLHLGLDGQSVVEIVNVEGGGPAQGAGLERGDLIYGLNGKTVAAVDDIHRILSQCPPSTHLEAHILRRGRERTLLIVSGEERSGSRTSGAARGRALRGPAAPRPPWLGPREAGPSVAPPHPALRG